MGGEKLYTRESNSCSLFLYVQRYEDLGLEILKVAKINLSKADIIELEKSINNYIFEIFFKDNGILLREIILDFRFLRWAEPIAMIYFGYQFRKIIEYREGIVVSIIEGTGKMVVTVDGWAYLNILFHMLLKVKILVMLKGIIPIFP